MIYYKCDICGEEQSSGIEQKASQSNPLGQKLIAITSYSTIRRVNKDIEHLCVLCDDKFKKLYRDLRVKLDIKMMEETQNLINKLKKN